MPVRRQIWGRRQGPGLKPARRKLLEERLPALRVVLPEHGMLDPSAQFAEPLRGFRLEIGFGGGEHLAAQATAHPELGFLGVEPFMDGVGKLVAQIDESGLRNVRVLPDDARLLLRVLPDSCLQRIDVLFPDPWPKARHQKRRIVNRETVVQMARVLAPGGELRLATDIVDYARWMLEATLAEPRLVWQAERADEWRLAPADHVRTRYQAKAEREGRPAVFLRFLADK
ncbi:MAG TPA: tRNA (guanosine(46)-N7)-methyltransferase TrmB [Geminicoccus sp.]|jgi:tRNA (guanine-N7-)-methyltransferase|uniref:tRNA (guanosine(46)-N7)-methyltransferase TrmB n=1 Tax=Geminicoccus sp. TaxID=2024832 RepID=UPI002E350C26|nr:tRNA (guanosine(46)-N7)-methyltransferase TrmB [Geminicoccus sp.]HEX2526257.1 tRNA (guanosine(46)-N7)-methyltransferase TrmB [Geminicoccus sp.]